MVAVSNVDIKDPATIFVFALEGTLADNQCNMTKDVALDILYAMHRSRLYITSELSFEKIKERIAPEILLAAEGVIAENKTKLYLRSMRHSTDNAKTAGWYLHETQKDGLYLNYDLLFYNEYFSQLENISPATKEQFEKTNATSYNKNINVVSPADMLEHLYKIRFGSK